MKKSFIFTLAILFILLSFSCNKCNEKKSRANKVELRKEDSLKIKIHRYEKALFSLDQHNLQSGLRKIQREYRFFLDANLKDTNNVMQIRNYLNDPLVVNLYNDCIKFYPDVKDLELQLSKAFSYIKYYFPDKKVPQVYTYVSGMDYDNPVKYADSVLIIALDMYYGNDYKLYRRLGQPYYRQIRFRKDYILPDCMKAIAKTMVDNSKENKKFIDYIVYEGKLLYFLDATLPETQDSLKIGYTPSQMAWCIKNEPNIWSFIIDRKLLYTTDPGTITKFCVDGPFTPFFSKQSPPRLGAWIGWQIVRAYMEQDKNVALKELFTNQDAQDILLKSKYKPKK
jgi:gliding motility-associated lipoprotein GldB